MSWWSCYLSDLQIVFEFSQCEGVRGGGGGGARVVVSGSDTRQAAPHPHRRKSLTLAGGRVAKIDDVISYEVQSRLRASHPTAVPPSARGTWRSLHAADAWWQFGGHNMLESMISELMTDLRERRSDKGSVSVLGGEICRKKVSITQ